MPEKIDQKTLERWHTDPANWKLGIFYYNKEDRRLLPPKRIGWMGWTVNFANPWSVVVFILLIGIIVAISWFIDWGNA